MLLVTRSTRPIDAIVRSATVVTAATAVAFFWTGDATTTIETAMRNGRIHCVTMEVSPGTD